MPKISLPIVPTSPTPLRVLQAYAAAGADVVYAPGLRTEEEIGAVVRAVDRPLNVLVGLSGMSLTLDDLSRIGVRRISMGSGLARVAYSAAESVAREIAFSGYVCRTLAR